MAPPKRRASVQAEATNKLMLADADEESLTTNDTSPLTSLQTETPSPPHRMTRAPVEGGQKNMVQQVQQIARMRRDGVQVPDLIIGGKGKGKGKGKEKVEFPGLMVGGQGKGMGKENEKETGAKEAGGGSGKKGSNTPKNVKTKEGTVPQSTPAKGSGNGSKEGSTPKRLKVKDALLPPSTFASGGVNGSIRKRPVSAYLEDAPDTEEQEREHVRPAKRQWGVDTPFTSQPVNNPLQMLQNQQNLRNAQGDTPTRPPAIDPNLFDLSQLLTAEIRHQNNLPLFELFPSLPQYPVGRPAPPSFATLPQPKPTTDCLGSHKAHTKTLEGKKKNCCKEHKERLRLHGQFVKLMEAQKRDIEEKKQRPIATEDFTPRQPHTPNLEMLALSKLKPARKLAEPALFGTWHNSKPMHEEDAQGCTFCMFDCDFGVSDERVLLPVEASGGYCRACHESTMTMNEELEVMVQAELVNEVDNEVQARLDTLEIAAATPPLKELGDKMRFKHVAKEFMIANLRASASPQMLPGNGFGMGNSMTVQQQQMMRAFVNNGGSPRLPPSPILRSAPPTPRMSGLVGISVRQQYQHWLRNLNGGARVGPNTPRMPAQDFATFMESLGPEQQYWLWRHLSAVSRAQVSPHLGTGARSPRLQSSMLNGGMAGNNNHQRSLSNISNPQSPTSLNPFNDTGMSNTQHMGLGIYGLGRSPVMQTSMPNSGHIPNQRRLSNDNMPSVLVQSPLSGNKAPNAQQMARDVNGPGGSPIMQASMLSGAQVPIQRCFSNSSGTPLPSQIMVNGDPTPINQQKGGLVNAGLLAGLPRVGSGAGSPIMEPSMLNGAGHTNNPNQRRFSNSGNRPMALQDTPNGNGDPNTQQVAQDNGVLGAIALTRSGGVIAPTPIPTNTFAKSSASLAQSRSSNGQQIKRSASGPSSSPPSQNGAGIPNNTNVGPHPSGSSPPAPPHATINGCRNSNGQQMMGVVKSNVPTLDTGSPSTNGTASPMLPSQPDARSLSTPSLNPPGASLPTPSLSPPTPKTSPSLLKAPFQLGHPHAHPHQYVQRSRTDPGPLSPGILMGPPPRPAPQRTISATDGRETTIYQGLLFCRGSPWRQVDVRKARICDDCKAEKLAITKHRHTRFHLLCEKRHLPNKGEGQWREGTGWGGVMGGEGKKTGCMVCTEVAAYGCDGCTLKLCADCEVKVTMMCKGHLNNLIYMHGDRAHIRNDAFLLRNDGGGY